MQEISFLSTFNNWISQYYVSILWSAAVVTLHLVIVKWTLPKIKSGVKISRLSQASAKKAFNIVRIIVGTITLSCLFIVWGIFWLAANFNVIDYRDWCRIICQLVVAE